ncbi:acyl-CoA carboxylase subunit epsilon [Catellatospora sichuanensis]|uniref:acyl-CoA carboxylase subunit epsilon n=1 Tax=Catellatospora sichuanensis TaxID=1969805 RepID=UPI0011833BB6|nr:acyl-CoA carboxylase subunit epsilon [Catellatospora sichuanensis]
MTEQPVIRIERGTPTAEEVAALVAVLSARPAAAPAPPAEVSAWWRSGLPPVTAAGPGAWRRSGLPR